MIGLPACRKIISVNQILSMLEVFNPDEGHLQVKGMDIGTM